MNADSPIRSTDPRYLTCVSKLETHSIDVKGKRQPITKRKFKINIADIRELVFSINSPENPVALLSPQGSLEGAIVDEKNWVSKTDRRTYWKLTKPGKSQPDIVSCVAR